MTQTDASKTTAGQSGLRTYHGNCLCGAVAYEATVDLAGASRCNCSICTKYGGAGVTLKPSAFRLVKGQEHLSEYRRGDSPNYRAFCKHCGVLCFGAGDVPSLGGEFVSINVNALEDVDPGLLTYGYWDGRHDNWMAGTRPTPWPIRAEA
ncbi:GFA family protein [Pyxidicoccus xibeiensis]|uniref:GFA family protein n=1 Tax=Pyxidicoccus xibeiensis TaxID=2906759 RepID=UPI0020A706C3|nr:GFA family protein [Pyxidicoccus xibeiensis]MCP3135972.1 GFA family protein [Pyxidicoccus xibeiensis]